MPAGIGQVVVDRWTKPSQAAPSRFEVMDKSFVAEREDRPGQAWLDRFRAGRVEAVRWYLGDGRPDLPTAAACRAALRQHMPELVPHYDDACAMVGDDDLAHRILSHYRPATQPHGCTLFAREAGAGPQRTVILLLDGAGWHTEPGLAIAEGVRLVYLPPYTPELQRAEHLWRVVDEPIANRHFDRLAEVQDQVERRCRDLEARPDTLGANTLFRWWPHRPKPS